MNLEELRHNLIVSCQALDDEPLHGSTIMARMALAAKEGGAKGIRANTIEDINAIKNVVDLPVIGIIKIAYSDSPIYITPTIKEVNELLTTSAEIIALDATDRHRPNDEQAKPMIDLIHDNGRLAMADISNFEEGIKAEKDGFDLVSTTLSGYTEYTPEINYPDFDLVENLSSHLKIPVIMEGHTTSPLDVRKAFDLGAFSAVVGGAITRPQQITRFFVDNIK
jgi:N-acylglucosamine-6-phosphate 2-epimerase